MSLYRQLNIGFHEVLVPDKIVELAVEIGLNYGAAKDILNHVISEFSNNGIGNEYYGYHGITHELEVTFFTLLSAKFHFEQKEFSQNDINTLFIATLPHDFDPSKEFDKPHNDNVELFIRDDKELSRLIVPFEIDLNIVLALIHRTTYPFKGKHKEHALKRMQELFSLAGVHRNDTITSTHYEELGRFLSICDRIAGYSLGDFMYANELVTVIPNRTGSETFANSISDKEVESEGKKYPSKVPDKISIATHTDRYLLNTSRSFSQIFKS